jgi:hypothetical protein
MEQVKKVGKNLNFAWAGVLERGGPHYYRVQSPTFLIEYDNTQNDANHIHSVWRDYNGDFGLDVLKAHYQTSHPVGKAATIRLEHLDPRLRRFRGTGGCACPMPPFVAAFLVSHHAA